MRAEASTTVAEIAAGLRDGPGSDSQGFRFGSDIQHPHDLPVFKTFICDCLANGRHKVTPRLGSRRWSGVIMAVLHAGGSSRAGTWFLLRKLGELHTEQ